MKKNEGNGIKTLNWDVYDGLLPIKLLNQIDFFYKGKKLFGGHKLEQFTQNEVNNLASRVLAFGDGQEVKYHDCTMKCTKIKDYYNITATKKIGDANYLFLTAACGPERQRAEMMYVEDYIVKGKIYINSDGVKYVTSGDYFAFKDQQPEEEQEKGE